MGQMRHQQLQSEFDSTALRRADLRGGASILSLLPYKRRPDMISTTLAAVQWTRAYWADVRRCRPELGQWWMVDGAGVCLGRSPAAGGS